jgi:hypothetical protein
LKFLNEEVWGYVNTNVSNGGGLRCFNCVYHEDFIGILQGKAVLKFNGPKIVIREV